MSAPVEGDPDVLVSSWLPGVAMPQVRRGRVVEQRKQELRVV